MHRASLRGRYRFIKYKIICIRIYFQLFYWKKKNKTSQICLSKLSSCIIREYINDVLSNKKIICLFLCFRRTMLSTPHLSVTPNMTREFQTNLNIIEQDGAQKWWSFKCKKGRLPAFKEIIFEKGIMHLCMPVFMFMSLFICIKL